MCVDATGHLYIFSLFSVQSLFSNKSEETNSSRGPTLIPISKLTEYNAVLQGCADGQIGSFAHPLHFQDKHEVYCE